MKRWLFLIVSAVLLTSCKRYPSTVEETTFIEEIPQQAEPAEIKREPVKVKGVYISAYVAGTPSMMEEILKQIEQTEINAVVIDVKNDEGRLTFQTEGPLLVNEIEASVPYIRNIQALIKELKERGIYTIARVVAFRDPYLAEKKPEWSLKNADGSIYRDKKGMAWVNPYKKEVWDYLIDISKIAANVGFDEVQFDYVRFAVDKTMNQVVYDPQDTLGMSKAQVITAFMEYTYEQLSKEGIFVSADVFGAIITSEEDAQSVGQMYTDLADYLDYISPMVYPSHYISGNFGIDYPDQYPYETVLAALNASKVRQPKAIVRPWLQDFTASYLEHYIPYGVEEVRAQIQAVYDAGYEEWILWNASNKYTWSALVEDENN